MTILDSQVDSVKIDLVAESMEALALYENRLRFSRAEAKPSFNKSPTPFTQNDSSKSGENCPVCNSPGHKLNDCKGFLLKSTRERYAV